VPSGRFFVEYATEESDYARAGRVNITRPSRIEVERGHPTQRSLGLAAGIAGSVLVPVSILVALASGEGGDSSTGQRVFVAGGFFGGLILTVVGWPLFGSARAKVTVTPTDAR
jgi:hypothetical protein